MEIGFSFIHYAFAMNKRKDRVGGKIRLLILMRDEKFGL